MGRPWWHDSYWEKKRSARREINLPKRQIWVWIAVVVLSILLAAGSTGFRPLAIAWLAGSIYYLCRILAYAIIIRVILSWFMIGRRNLLVDLLGEVTEPILSPLRRIVPRLGIFDVTPIIAIAVLYFIPFILSRILA